MSCENFVSTTTIPFNFRIKEFDSIPEPLTEEFNYFTLKNDMCPILFSISLFHKMAGDSVR